MTHSVTLPARIVLPAIFLAVGAMHCGSDDEPRAPAGGGSSSGGASGKGSVAGTSSKAGSGGNRVDPGTGGDENGSGGIGGAEASGGGAPGGEGGIGGEAYGGTAGSGGEGGEGGGDPQAVLQSILVGTFAPLPAYAAQNIGGRALLYRTLAGGTHVSIQVLGLQAATAYPSHVHNQPCAVLAGSHYLLDPAAAPSDANELWLPFTTNADGVGVAEKSAAGHLARGDALSIVVHDPAAANAKMVCADLSVGSAGDLAAGGTFAPFAAAEAIDQTIGGTVELVRSGSGTAVTLNVTGLDSVADYDCHVHAFPCGVMSAGGHYKLDPTNAATVENNELWPNLGDTTDGAATGPTGFAHRARLDAQSVVIHRSANAATPKVACADLAIDNYPNVELQGVSQLLTAATPDYTALTATARFVRGLDGMTRVHVVASGLKAGVAYPAHVHNLPCSLLSGGGHYLRDKAAAATEQNEVWLPLPADAGGDVDARVAVEHIASADARSIVIHDPDSAPVSARLACINLD